MVNNQNTNNAKPQNYKVPFVSAKIDRLVDNAGSSTKAYASIIIGNHFAIHGLKICEKERKLSVLWPANQNEKDGKWYETAHPVTKESRDTVEDYVIKAYKQKCEQNITAEQKTENETIQSEPTM